MKILLDYSSARENSEFWTVSSLFLPCFYVAHCWRLYVRLLGLLTRSWPHTELQTISFWMRRPWSGVAKLTAFSCEPVITKDVKDVQLTFLINRHNETDEIPSKAIIEHCVEVRMYEGEFTMGRKPSRCEQLVNIRRFALISSLRSSLYPLSLFYLFVATPVSPLFCLLNAVSECHAMRTKCHACEVIVGTTKLFRSDSLYPKFTVVHCIHKNKVTVLY